MASGGTLVKSQKFTPSKGAPAYLRDMLKDIGMQEWVMNSKGKKISNPNLQRYIAKAMRTKAGSADEAKWLKTNTMTTAWCAYWLNAKLEYAGIPGTASGMARSFLKWGVAVKEDDWREGDIVVTWRGSHNDGVTGHVFALLRWDKSYVYGVGGNQGDQVSIQAFPRRRKDKDGKMQATILGVRRPRSLAASKTVQSTGGAAASHTAHEVVDAVIPQATPDVAVAPVQGAPEGLPVGELVDTADRALPWIEQLSAVKPYILAALSVLTVAFIAYAAYCRYRAWRAGQ